MWGNKRDDGDDGDEGDVEVVFPEAGSELASGPDEEDAVVGEWERKILNVIERVDGMRVGYA